MARSAARSVPCSLLRRRIGGRLSQATPASGPLPLEENGVARTRRPLWFIGGAAAVVLLTIVLLVLRAEGGVNRTPLGGAPRPVSFVPARAGEYRPQREYVGTLESWVEAAVGPQYISAYVETVRV